MARINGRYRVVSTLGGGAHGRVYHVEDLDHDACGLALKVLLPGAPASLLRWEFATLRELSHPNLVRVHDLDVVRAIEGAVPDGLLGASFLTEDLVPGEPVDRRVPRGADGAGNPAWIAAVAAAACRALEHLHDRGVVHRDVKPANLVVDVDPSAAVLVDLALSTTERAGRPSVAGSVAYMAPEALAGAAQPRSDLFGLGVVMHVLALGRHPFAGDSGDPAAVARAILAGRRRLAAPDDPPLDPRLGAVVDGLLAQDARRRPPSARAVLEDLGRRFGPEVVGLAAGLEGEATVAAGRAERARVSISRRRGPLVGRAAEVDLLATLVAERLDPDRTTGHVVVVAGPAGCGKTALAREVLDRVALGAGGVGALGGGATILRGDPRAVFRGLRREAGPRVEARLVDGWLGGDPGGGVRASAPPDAAALVEQLVGLALAVARRAPLLVHLERDDAGLGRAVWTALHRRGEVGVAAGEPPLALAVVAEVRREPGQSRELPAGVPVVDVRLLSAEEVRELVEDRLGAELPDALLRALASSSRGRPLLVLATLARLAALGPVAGLDERDLARVPAPTDAAEAVAAASSALSAAARDALAALSAWGRSAGAAELGELLGWTAERAGAALAELVRAGWVDVDEAGRACPPGGDLAAALAPGGHRARALHRRASRLLARVAPHDLEARARHAVAANDAAAPRLALAAGRALLVAGDPAGALDILAPAAASPEVEVATEARRVSSTAALAAGRYELAVELLRRAVAAGEAGTALELARALRLAGDVTGAAEAARACLDEAPWAARALLARLALDRGSARDALDALGDVAPGDVRGPEAVELEEAAGLARLAAGEVTAAAAHFEVCLATADAAADPVATARAHSLVAMVAHRRERWAEMAEHAAEAERLAARAGHAHAAATYAVNGAIALVEGGELAAASAALRAAVTSLASLGRERELAGALYNLAALHAALGDVAAARRVAARARAAAQHAGAAHVAAYCELLEAELLVRAAAADPAQRAAAAAAVRRATSAFDALGAAHEASLARLFGAELQAAFDPAAAAAAIDEVAAAAAPLGVEELRARVALTRGRVAAGGHGDVDLAEREVEAARALVRDGASDLSWRLAATSARLAARRGDRGAAARRLAVATAAIDERRRSVPEPQREAWSADPDRAAAAALLAALRDPVAVESPDARDDAPAGRNATRSARPAALRTLLDINKRLNSELRLGRLLDEIIDTIVRLTDAERGFLLLRDRDGTLRPRSARNVDRASLSSDELRLSLSIAERVVASGEPVLTVDALADGRFDAAESVHALRLRSILAVPLRVKGEVVGAVYVDDRVRPNAFGDDAVALALDVADQAAIAIDNARLLAENKRRQRKIESLARELKREVDRQKVQLDELRRELDEQRSGLATKYSYDAIVARSAAMAKVFKVLDRVTDSEVPVVIQGESGTGKELVARAIHFNGPRRARAFVTENCGAIPETLLESVLFGHVRGAFTGADRSRQGLFEIASGGTLLLDEIGETSPAMQAKFLRVLQEGELRPVGGDRTVRVDVRVITASNRDLADLVRRGEFREDLFYRLNVITVRLPPLRDRAEDVPLLVEHFIAKHGAGRVTGVDRTALRCLVAHSWPGNVRQLENEVMRATVLADDVIREEHLSPEILEGASTSPRPDDLDLRAHVAHLERELIARALERFGHNQSRAAKALGLSRFGLQKKLARYAMRP